MKKLSTYLFLILFSSSAPSFADDISDFQIEGMSIGASLLDSFSEEEISKNVTSYFDNDHEYMSVEFVKLKSFKTYEHVVIGFKRVDQNFIIESITGVIFTNRMTECKKLQNNIDKEISVMLNNTDKKENNDDHNFDPTGESKTKAINHWFNNNDLITIICTDWSDAITNKFGWTDNLSVELKTKEYNDKLYQ